MVSMELLLTNDTVSTADVYAILEDQDAVKLLLATYFICISAIGAFLLLSIFFYEKYEEDPQKRSILNQVDIYAYLCWFPIITVQTF